MNLIRFSIVQFGITNINHTEQPACDCNLTSVVKQLQLLGICVTVDLTIFYSLNCCTRIIFTLCYCVFFKIFFFTFIYSCVLSSVFYTINEWMNASNKYLFIVLMLIFSAWCICAVCVTGPSSSLSPSVSFFRFSSVILCFAAKSGHAAALYYHLLFSAWLCTVGRQRVGYQRHAQNIMQYAKLQMQNATASASLT